jgi:beta-barrel assembly-enhancing protease
MASGRFFDGETAAAHDVDLHLTDGNLVIEGAVQRVWAAFMIVAGEADSSGTVTLSIPGSSARLEIADPMLLRALAVAGVRIVSPAAWRARHWVWFAAIGIACVVIAVVGLAELPRLLAPVIPESWERQLARPVEALLEANKHVCTGADGQQALDRLAERLRQAGGIKRRVRLIVLDDPLVNAFTLPGGRVVVMRGLIDEADDGPELAGVIAHEFGHVAHYDPTAMMIRQFGISLLETSIGLGDSSSVGAGLSRDLLTRSYGRDAETAADAAAIDTLTKANLRADGLSRFFERLEARESDGAHGGGWLSTHPPTDQRRARVARGAEGQEPFTAPEWDAIRRMCGPPSKTR